MTARALLFGGPAHGVVTVVPNDVDGLPLGELLTPGEPVLHAIGDGPAVSIATYYRAGDQPGPGGLWRYEHPSYAGEAEPRRAVMLGPAPEGVTLGTTITVLDGTPLTLAGETVGTIVDAHVELDTGTGAPVVRYTADVYPDVADRIFGRAPGLRDAAQFSYTPTTTPEV